jgi:hypothetical protein
MSRDQLLGVAFIRAAVIGVGAAVVAAGVAVAGSSLMPIGLARVAEPHPGIAVDGAVVDLGVLVVILVVLAIASGPAWRAAVVPGTVAETGEAAGRARPSFVATALARMGLAPTAVAGTRMALEPGRGRTAVPVRSALAGTALAVAAVIAAFTFAGSFQHLFDTPRLYGWNWDAVVGNPYVGDISKRVAPTLPRQSYVGAVAGGNVLTPVEVIGPGGSAGVNAFGLEQLKGAVHPPIVSGRWPEHSDEIALGAKTISSIGARVGGTVDVRSGDRVLRHLRVVGRAVFVDVSATGLGEGAGLTFQALRSIKPRAPENVFPVRFVSGIDLRTARSQIRRDYTGTISSSSDEVSGLGDLRPVKGFPIVLAVLLALAAAATIAHTLVTSIRRKRRDLALLKTLGFVKRQVSTTVAWQASSIALISVAVGVPIGIAAGRWAWAAFADTLGVVPEPAVPLLATLLTIPTTVVLANLIAAVPGWIAGRVRPAETLRTE